MTVPESRSNVTRRWLQRVANPSDTGTCQTPRCGARLAYYVCSVYTRRWRDYHTGREQVRPEERRRRSCERHARRFAERHGLEMP
jgi:hypothetical protein